MGAPSQKCLETYLKSQENPAEFVYLADVPDILLDCL